MDENADRGNNYTPKVFISYEHTDQKMRKKLEEHLSPLTRSKTISIWQDQVILAGGDWNHDIQEHLNEADIILLLVSARFIASSYCWDGAVEKALKRHKTGTVHVIPIILKPIDWKNTPLGQLKELPTKGKSISQWSNPDAAFEDVVRGIRKVVTTLQTLRRNNLEEKRSIHERDNSQKRLLPSIHVNADARYIIGVDIDRSHLTLLLTDSSGNIIEEESPAPFDTNAGARVCLTRVAEELQFLVEGSRATWEQVIGIGLATPGPLDRDMRRVLSISQRVLSAPQKVLSASQMFGWEGIDILDYMEHKLKKKVPIYLDNDANMGALGESRYGAGQDITDLVYVKIGIGIGAGFIINGRLHRGNTKAAGELGHIVVEEKGKICSCGNRGCLETVAAEPAIVKDACEGISLRVFSPDSTQIPSLYGGVEKVDIASVIEAAKNNDEASQAALKQAGEWIGRALGTVINLFNPSMILLDGEVIRKTEVLFDALQHTAQESSLHATWNEVKIRTCNLETPVALGAVANVIDHMSSDYR